MITIGMDLGSQTVKIVIMKDGKVIARAKELSGFEQEVTASDVMKDVLTQADLKPEAIDRIVATGAGRKTAPFTKESVTGVGAAARGAIARFPTARTVLDVGAEEGRAIVITPEGKVKDFAINEKCAAGSGTFIEAMARALEITVVEFGKLALTSDKAVPMNAQCAVFAESEVVSLLHARTPKNDITRAVCDAIASRIISMARRVSIEPEVVLIGGMAYNVGFLASLKRTLEETEIHILDDPEYVGAEGAAWIAHDKIVGKTTVHIQD
ncbi:MAG: acyl-CoA dehydratase activase [Candidatus Electryoneaceae bacterium]|nr:acyl-CoA dehydratase activase [Candidatus Electryoneaceae bacterium]